MEKKVNLLKIIGCGLAVVIIAVAALFAVRMIDHFLDPFYYRGDFVDLVAETQNQEDAPEGMIRIVKKDMETGRCVVTSTTYRWGFASRWGIGPKTEVTLPNMEYDGTTYQLIFQDRIFVGYLDMKAQDYIEKVISRQYETERLQEIFDEYNRQVSALDG